MPHRSCPGYLRRPFSGFVADYPGEDLYPAKDFRVEWGPIFHRGRLDGSARVVVLGQDPATHETISRRILVGEAGQRVQGLLARIGIVSSYVMINTFLYSVYGQGGGTRHARDEKITDYRNRWLDALLVDSEVTAVISLGVLADQAYRDWAATQPTTAEHLHHAPLRHPTYPESASRSGGKTLAEATADLLANWSEQLPALHGQVRPDEPTALRTYGTGWEDGDLAEIPEGDLPAGCPAWMRSLDSWAVRTGDSTDKKRATITVTVPRAARAWPPLG